MTDRAAIERLFLMAKGGTNFSEKSNEACRMGAEALQEREERSKGCEFCCYQEYPDRTLYPKDGYQFYAGYWKQFDVDEFDEYEIDNIDFCPMCGRPLKGTDNET